MTPFEVLGVREDAPLDEIRRAYVDLARRHHPDHFAEASDVERERAMRRMQEINEAWRTVNDPAWRQRRAREAPPRPFRPFSPTADEPDPRLAPDAPYRPPVPDTFLRRAITLAPAGLLVASAACMAMGVLYSAEHLWSIAVVLFFVACAGFLAIPLMALGRATRDDG